MQAQTYQRASRLLAQANEELAIGDTRQASEKGWGAAAQIVKAVAAQRGWQHNNHGGLYQIVDRLAGETGDRDIAALFHVASSSHVNIYEDWLPSAMVEDGLREVGRFLDKLEPLLK
jgi:uncharacterized protein (UPF0332 family)